MKIDNNTNLIDDDLWEEVSVGHRGKQTRGKFLDVRKPGAGKEEETPN